MSHARRTLVPLALAALILFTPLATPAANGALGEIVYLALGDSVPSGTDVSDGIGGYPRRLGQRLADATGQNIRLVNRARAGERSEGVLSGQLWDLRTLRPDLITLTIGANDFMVPAFECAAAGLDGNPDTRCSGASLLQAVPRFESNLQAILRQLAAETDATIVVTTYYNPFPRGSRCAPGLADLSLRFLNTTIADVAAEVGDRGTVVDLAPVFRGHEGRAPNGWFSPSPIGLTCTDIHPSAAGHEAIASAIWSRLEARAARAP